MKTIQEFMGDAFAYGVFGLTSSNNEHRTPALLALVILLASHPSLPAAG
jgi:hypothetical protein